MLLKMSAPRSLAVCLFVLVMCRIPAVPAQSRPVGPALSKFDKLPLSFETNEGQADSRIRYLVRSPGYALFLTDQESIFVLSQENDRTNELWKKQFGERGPEKRREEIFRMQLAGAQPAIKVTGEDPLSGKVNYFLVNDATKWLSGIQTFKTIKYRGVYPGVDLLYHGNQRALEFDFLVAARASAAPIKMRFVGARKLKLDEQGNLIVCLCDGQIAFHAPVAYQERAGVRASVKAGFAIAGTDSIGFALGSYDDSRELIIDPVLTYSTYLSGNQFDALTAMTIDAAGNAYVTGNAYSCDFPTTPGAFDSTLPGCVGGGGLGRSVVFVTKVNPAGSSLVYSTFLGTGTASAIAVDTSGDVYVAGWAQTGFP